MFSQNQKVNYRFFESGQGVDPKRIEGKAYEGYKLTQVGDRVYVDLYFVNLEDPPEIWRLPAPISELQKFHAQMGGTLPYFGKTCLEYRVEEGRHIWVFDIDGQRRGFGLIHSTDN